MNSSGSMTHIYTPGISFLPEVRREPRRCKCGEALEFYGERNGIIGWWMTMAAINSATSDLCSKCYRKSLEKG